MNAEMSSENVHAISIRRGRFLEYFTIGWNSLEAVVAITFGVFAGALQISRCFRQNAEK